MSKLPKLYLVQELRGMITFQTWMFKGVFTEELDMN